MSKVGLDRIVSVTAVRRRPRTTTRGSSQAVYEAHGGGRYGASRITIS